ncbi:MAG: GHMP kinase [Gemmatimonadetes bacterium]|nr:GHMP kinase [Gemmatimonadota bacterium]NNM06397.1 GHMP kinase [Gemmatimonadota bacterium]
MSKVSGSPTTLAVGHAYARAGLLGNPSDVYHGRVLSVVLRNFQATVSLEESSDLRIESHALEEDVFHDMEDLADSVRRQGYYGGRRLIKATVKVFHEYCKEAGHTLPIRSFTARYRSSIPRQVGLAGSSAIITATLRALMSFFQVEIPLAIQPNLILSAEFDELGITAGLMDRVVQVFEGLVYMDLSTELMGERGHGAYESMDTEVLPRMYLAHHPTPTKVSGQLHSDLRTRWEQGDQEVRDTVERIADLASEGRSALLAGDHETFSSLMNENFALRQRIMQISEWDLAVAAAARSLGASAKLTGSGGAIIGVVETEDMFDEVREKLDALGAKVVEPVTT